MGGRTTAIYLIRLSASLERIVMSDERRVPGLLKAVYNIIVRTRAPLITDDEPAVQLNSSVVAR